MVVEWSAFFLATVGVPRLIHPKTGDFWTNAMGRPAS